VTSEVAAAVDSSEESHKLDRSEGKGHEGERKEIGNDDLNNLGNGPGPGYSFRRLSRLGKLAAGGFAGCA
jgi:hypothetical protein